MATPRTRRPFYGEFAWAADLIIDRPVQKECGIIVEWLVERGVVPGAALLDAGCGTGRYAIELGRRGYRVHGVDLSPNLLEEARRSAGHDSPHVSFAVADIRTLPNATYDAVLCRGVLNDLIDDESRRLAFASFRRVLRHDGVLIFDVREWEATAARKVHEPLFRKRVDTGRGRLTFTSVTEVDPATRRLLVHERHAIDVNGRERATDYEFIMRCWTLEELDSALRVNGFASDSWFGAYDPAIAPGHTDRLVVVAQCSLAGRTGEEAARRLRDFS